MRKEQIQRYIHYLKTYWRHASPGRLINLARVEYRRSRAVADCTGCFPYYAIIDINSGCNLSCPLCQMGRGENIVRKNRMNLETFKKIIAPLHKHLFQIFLYNWTEPFLNRDIYEIIAWAQSLNIGTCVSTNFNAPIDPDRLISSGLEYLIISADGITQDIYSKYRRSGDIQIVFSNVKNLVAAKKRLNSRLPFIEWQCLVNKYNERQLDIIKKTAIGMGVDSCRFANLNFYSVQAHPEIEKDWLPQNPQFTRLSLEHLASLRKGRKRKPCFWLWRSAIITCDGGLVPCCLYDIDNWGSILDDGFTAAWNSDTFKEARQRSLKNSTHGNSALVCDKCPAPFIFG